MSPRVRRALLATLGLGLAAVCAELVLRWLLFGDHTLGWRVRRPALFADHRVSEDFFLLQRRFGLVSAVPPALYHPRLGWVSEALDTTVPERVVHRRLAEPAPGRAVLLFGDSYMHGTTPEGERIEDHLATLDPAREFRVLNHGVRGYGLDQVVLLVEATLDNTLAALGDDARPVVVLGVYVDDDLDRCALGLRGWPKPRFVLGPSELELVGVPVPTLDEYATKRPLGITSYVARLLIHEERLWPRAWQARLTGEAAQRDAKAALTDALVARFAAFTAARGVEAFAVVFAGEGRTLDDGARDWRDEALEGALQRHGVPFVRTATALRAAAARDGTTIADHFGREGETVDHFDGDGNRVAAEVILAGLRGEREGR